MILGDVIYMRFLIKFVNMEEIKIEIVTRKVISGPSKVFPTGKKPFLVLCDDFNEYVFKHNLGRNHILFNEYISSIFIKLFKIKSPDFCFIDFNTEKFLNFEVLSKCNNELNNSHFTKIGLGFAYLEDTYDLINDINQIPKKKDLKLVKQLLEIALFDIWVANEDRVNNNSNLLFGIVENQNVIYAIDHGSVFNNNSEKEIYLITYEDSFLYSDFAYNLLSKCNINELERIINQVIEEFFNSVNLCKSYVVNMKSDDIPKNWNIDLTNKKDYLSKNLFNENWAEDSVKQFKEFLNETIRR